MSDFNPEFKDPQKFLNCVYAFQLVHNSVFSVDNMSDEELRQSIIEDLLAITMWEKQFGEKLHFGFTRLFNFVLRSQRKRITEQMKHPEIEGLIHIFTPEGHDHQQLRIIDKQPILQAAMDYCGCWYSGFNIPSDALRINHERIEELGGFDAVVDLVATEVMPQIMEQEANAPFTTTVN